MSLKTVRTPSLDLAFYEHGSPQGWPVVLSHGFPYDIHAYDAVVPRLVAAGARVFVPYLRGFGKTRFHSASTIRSGQQSALASDLIALLDANGIETAIVAGFDWGGLASCAAALLWPSRITGLVSYAGYDIANPGEQKKPNHPELERTMWYQHLFQHERGKQCLSTFRRDLCYRLWQEWSPSWSSLDQAFSQTEMSFGNPDFVNVVIHAYRYALGTEKGDPALQHFEDKLAARPKITVPTITLDGTQDPLKPGGTGHHDPMFSGRHERREFNVGHAFPLENPAAFAEAVIDVHNWATETLD
jgi:pimeloyl-ACP methyl ester carboxylesterase